MSKFDLSHFMQFCSALRIDSKECGIMNLSEQNMLGTQRWVMKEIVKGLEDGKRNFVTLKCRQIGISTISLAFDLYWMFRNDALSGSLVVHEDGAREQFRQSLTMYHGGLPNHWRQNITSHNRHHMVFGNGSRLQFKVAGTTAKKSSGSLGRSSALAFLHATEMSSWGDQEGIVSLRSALAETNPIRFYHWESTARGFNLFYDMWEEAKKSVTQVPIFVSFWANENYRLKRGSMEWQSFWGKSGRMTPEEKSWVRDVKLLYGVQVDDEQIAWYRWKIADNAGDIDTVQQEFPATENHAFLATGTQFFSTRSISDAIKRTKSADEPSYYRMEFLANFWDTQVVVSNKRLATLKIWEGPQPLGTTQYVLGCDPAYGSSSQHDNHSISVWRCYGDKVVQVAEFCDADLATYGCAWAMCYLAGLYDPCLVNLEITGPGEAVFNEVRNLRKVALFRKTPSDQVSVFNVLRNMRNFLYKQVDQISGQANAMHWKTSLSSKERAMGTYRSYFERGIAVPVSYELVNEMKGITREDGSAPEASSRTKDDRVSAASLAVTAWSEMLMVKLQILGHWYEKEEVRDQVRSQQRKASSNNMTSRLVQDLFKQIGFKP